jgi:hypothetical protein
MLPTVVTVLPNETDRNLDPSLYLYFISLFDLSLFERLRGRKYKELIDCILWSTHHDDDDLMEAENSF